MDNKDLQCILENYYRNMETMQPADKRYKTDYDRHNSTPEWEGLTDPSKGPSMLTPSVDEEEPDTISKVRNLIEMEIKRAPKKMTYAVRVLKSILSKIGSL
jgi:hypothetical protein